MDLLFLIGFIIAYIFVLKKLLIFLPEKVFKIKPYNHFLVDKILLSVYKFLGGLLIVLVVGDYLTGNFSVMKEIKEWIVPIGIWFFLPLFAIALGLIFLESSYRENKFYNKHGMDQETYENLQIKRNQKFIYDLELNYGKPSAIIDFVKDKETTKAYFIDQANLIIIESNGFTKDNIPFSSILDFRPSSEQILVRNGTAYTTSKSNGFGFGRFLFFGFGNARAKTVYTEAVYDTIYSIDLTINTLSHPVYKMHFGKNKESFDKAISLFTIILNKNKLQNKFTDLTPPPIPEIY